jgi:hypothetical protein
VRAVDLLERPMELEGLRHEGDVTEVPVRAYQIVTLAAERV